MSTLRMPALLFAQGGSNAALFTFVVYTLGVFVLAGVANRLLQKKEFISEYFLGSRGLGVWAFALTFAATSSSGGSFTGFPSKIYTHGWILALWIGSYMVVPICTMGILGKRLNQVARISGAITVPDVIRDRFRSPLFGLICVSLIVFFMSFNLVAQFKAGSLILKTLLSEVELFHTASASVCGPLTASGGLLEGIDPEYLLCLAAFGVAVVIYTTYGGFHAVVWTDVMQGVVMVGGVLIMLPLALSQVADRAPEGMGALEYATRQMARMTTPRRGTAELIIEGARDTDLVVPAETWVVQPAESGDGTRLLRVAKQVIVPAGETTVPGVDVLEITTPHEIERITAELSSSGADPGFVLTDVSVGDYRYGASQPGVYVTGPGPVPGRSADVGEEDARGFLPFSLAISFFFMWAISGSGQPSNMVRLMAFRNSETLRRAIFTVAVYYSAIYLPLVIIFCCARVLLPGMEAESDRIMPEMAVFLTHRAGVAWLAGLLVAAPFAAVMSTVDSFLLMISSALVRDIYQRNINPDASERSMKYLSYFFTLLVGTAAMLGAINPPRFLQDIIVYTGSGLAACFLAPVVFAMFWPRANAIGCMSGMLAGFAVHLSLYLLGIVENHSFFEPVRLFNFDPIIIGLVVSFATVFVVTKLTPPPPEDLVRNYFFCKP